MDNKVSKSAWLVALWSVVFVAIGIVITSVIATIIIGFQWGLLLNVFKIWWLAYLLIIGFVYFIVLLIIKYPLRTISFSLFIVAFLFVLASPKNNEIALKLNSAIYDFADVNLLIGAFTILAFVLAFYAIYRERKKNQ